LIAFGISVAFSANVASNVKSLLVAAHRHTQRYAYRTARFYAQVAQATLCDSNRATFDGRTRAK
jgi:hypothetical protein